MKSIFFIKRGFFESRGYSSRMLGCDDSTSRRGSRPDHIFGKDRSTFGEFLGNLPSIIITCELTLRLRRAHPTRARSNASDMLLRVRSLAGYTIDTHESNFLKRQGGRKRLRN